MIERIKIQNYKALREVSLELTPIHVLIGPNDSGKTSVLEAVAALCRSTGQPLPQAFLGAWEGRNLVWNRDGDLFVTVTAAVAGGEGNFDYCLAVCFPTVGRNVLVERETFLRNLDPQEVDLSRGRGTESGVFIAGTNMAAIPEEKRLMAQRVQAALGGLHYYRWSPGFLALPVAPDSNRRFRMDASGFGLALCLDDILGFDRDRFIALEKRFKATFPHVRSIKLMPEPAFRAPANDAEQVP